MDFGECAAGEDEVRWELGGLVVLEEDEGGGDEETYEAFHSAVPDSLFVGTGDEDGLAADVIGKCFGYFHSFGLIVESGVGSGCHLDCLLFWKI